MIVHKTWRVTYQPADGREVQLRVAAPDLEALIRSLLLSGTKWFTAVELELAP